jgi:hypothetical protein
MKPLMKCMSRDNRSSLATAIGVAFQLRRAWTSCGRRCRKATVVRDYLFLRQTQVAKYFNRTPW